MRMRRKVSAALAACVVVSVAVVVGAGPAGASQSCDSTPFYGGDRLTLASGATASSGWMLADYNYTYGTTAGHAGPDGTVLYSCVDVPAHYWGTVQQHTSYPGQPTTGPVDTDVAPISGAVGAIWSGLGHARFVYNWETTNQDIGSSVCTAGGMSEIEFCSIRNVAYHEPWAGGNYAVRSDCPGISACSTGGDSGSPVYAVFQSGPHAGEVEAVGEIVAGGTYTNGGQFVVWIPIRYIMQWVWTFNRHTNLICDICSPEP